MRRLRRPLTHDLLLMRSASLLGAVTDAGHDPKQQILSRVVCDGCGASVDLQREPWPESWTTDGDLERGFDDRCGECSP